MQVPHKTLAEDLWEIARLECGRRPYEIQLKNGTVIVGGITMADATATLIYVSVAYENDQRRVAIDEIATYTRYDPRAAHRDLRYPRLFG
jgi:hypothetical protein